MVASRTGFVWDIPPSKLADQLKGYGERLLRAIHALMDVYGSRLVTYAMANAPWTDRTSNARQGLSSRVIDETSTITLVLFHTMFYGIYLETKSGGRWGIIVETLENQYPNLMSALEALVS
jgi:hypothetical protein